MLKSIIIAGLIGLTGCVSATVNSPEMNYPFSAVDSAVEASMTMGIQGYSENHREFYSKPFLVVQDEKVMAAGLRDRGVAKVVVLGDSRPYTIEVEVRIERGKAKGDPALLHYKFVRYDKRLAKKLLQSIIASLEHRGRDKNIIDDFRSF